MNQLCLHQVMEINNEAAARIVRKEYAQGMETLLTGLRQLQTHLRQMSELSYGKTSRDICSDQMHYGNYSLDSWMFPAMEALHEDDGCSSTTPFFVYRRPLVVPPLHIGRARADAEYLNTFHGCQSGKHTSLVVAMLFNYGLACQLSFIEGRLNDGSQPEYDLLQKASQMYDFAITNLRRVTAESAGQRGIVASNIQFFRAAMNNLAVSEQTKYVLTASRNGSCPLDIPSNKGFERLRELLLRYPPASTNNEVPETTLWNCYLANILRAVNSFQPNYCAAAC